MVQTFQFEIPGDPRALRTIHDDAVAALDAALASALPGCEVMHAIDPRRILNFASGGPPVWSVGVVSHPSGVHQFLTYGLSRALDPAQPFDFELTMRVRSPGAAPMWPTLLLRSIARYHVSSGRPIRPGEFMELGGPISQMPVRPEERSAMPTTRMDTVLVVAGASVPTPRGAVEIRNVVGLDARERELLESCRAQGFCDELRRADPALSVALDSPSHADDPRFCAAIADAAARDGSDCGSFCVPGLRWSDSGSAYEIHVPAGAGAKLKRRLSSRLPFGRGLLVHSEAPGPGTELLVLPGDDLGVPEADPTRLVLQLPLDSPHVTFLADDPAVWTLRYGAG